MDTRGVVPDLWQKYVPLPDVGVFGLMAGSGPMAAVIRHATESPVGHAVIYVGSGNIVQARWPKVILSRAPLGNVIWAYEQPLTAEQRVKIKERALSLVGDNYDILAYPAFAVALFRAGLLKSEAPLFKNDRWRDCSAVVADCDAYAGAPITDLPDPNLVRPSDLLEVGLGAGWFSHRGDQTNG